MPFLLQTNQAMSVKASTFESWKKANKYLTIDSTNTVLTCGICKKWVAKLPGTNAFITGSKNLKSSAVADHVQSKLHARALQLEEEEQARSENRRVRVIVPPPSENSPISTAVSNMGRLGKEEKSSIQRLFEIAYLIAFKGRPYADFTDIVELEIYTESSFSAILFTKTTWAAKYSSTLLQKLSSKKKLKIKLKEQIL